MKDQYRYIYQDQAGKKESHRQNEREANEVVRLRVPVVYTAIEHEGRDELARSAFSLIWSGIAAGLGIFLSVVATGALAAHLPGGMANPLVHLGYTLGFLVVIQGRLQLFTENTITAVIPILSGEVNRPFRALTKLWSLVFFANLVGVFLAASGSLYAGIFPETTLKGMMMVSQYYIERDALAFFAQGIPAGFVVAALVWMMPSARGSEFWMIVAMTYLISLAGMTHVIAGSGETFMMLLLGEISLYDSLVISILPTLIGNIIGGTALFTLLAYGQVKEEL